MVKMNMKNINTLLSILLIFALTGCGNKITDHGFLNLVPESTLSSLETSNVQEMLNKVEKILNKQTKDMNVNEVLLAKAYYEDQKDIDMTIKCAERALLVCSDQNIAQKVTLQLAQTYLDQGIFDKAEKYAQEYQSLYPGTSEAKIAAYIDIQSNYLSLLDSDRDQKKTNKTLELAKNFLEKYSDQDTYLDSVNQIVNHCYNKVLDTEIGVISTYLDKYNYYNNFSSLNAAQRRLAYIKNKVLPFIKEKSLEQEKRISDIEITLAKASEKFNFIKSENQEQIS